jgi:hypothetical protein
MSPPTQSQSKDRGSTAGSGQSRANSRPAVSPTRSSAQSVGLSCPPSRLTEISNRPYTAVSTPTALGSQTQDAAHARPSSAFPSSSFTPQPNPLTPPMYFPRPDSASVSSSDYPSSFPSRDRPLATKEQYDESASPPGTAMLYNRPNTAELPPRRELPFRRDSLPMSSGSDSVRPTSRPSTGMMGPPPLPARVSDLRPGSAHTMSLDSELPPFRQPTIAGETVRPVSPVQQRPHTPMVPTKGCAKLTQATTVYEDHSSFPPTSSPQTYPTPASTSPAATRPLSAISNGTQSRRQSASPGVFPSSPASGGKDRPNYTTAPAILSDSGTTLEAYAMQSADGRKAALNDFIFKSLDSDDFLILVEDMETSWARLGLGRW